MTHWTGPDLVALLMWMPFSPSPSFNYLPIWNTGKFDCGGYKKMVIRGLRSIWLLTGVWVISEKKVQTDFKWKIFLLGNSKEIPTLPFWPELNLSFLANYYWPLFSLNILPVFNTTSYIFSLFNQYFFSIIPCYFSVISQPFSPF